MTKSIMSLIFMKDDKIIRASMIERECSSIEGRGIYYLEGFIRTEGENDMIFLDEVSSCKDFLEIVKDLTGWPQ